MTEYIKIDENGDPQEYDINRLKRDFPTIGFPIPLTKESLADVNVFELSSTEPDYDSNTEKLVKEGFELQGGKWWRKWSVVSLSTEELQQKEQAAIATRKRERANPENLIDALEILSTKVISDSLDQIPENDVAKMAPLFADYKINHPYEIGNVFNYNGVVLKVVQAHTSQVDWVPDQTPALYTAYRPAGSVSPWVQPTGAHDAYSIGERVSHDGKVWESTIDANTTVPGENIAHGYWTEVV